MPRNAAAANLVGVNTLERSGASTAHLFTTGTSLGMGNACLLSGAGTSPNNTAFGHLALATLPNTSTGFNVAIGAGAMENGNTATVTRSVAIGYQALRAATFADNIGIGYQAGLALGTGGSNVLIGRDAGAKMTTSSTNVCVGYQAGDNFTFGDSGVCVGYRAGHTITTGASNVCLGYLADGLAVGAASVVAVGASAKANTSGAALGASANATGANSVACGYTAAAAGTQATAVGQTTVASANYALAIGSKASATGIGSVAIGTDSGDIGASTAVLNEFKFGTANHRYNFPGQLNAPLNAGTQIINNVGTPAVGTDAATMAYVDGKVAGGGGGLTGTTSAASTFLGVAAGPAVTSGTGNTFVGWSAGNKVSTSGNNTALGASAGFNTTAGTGVFIGAEADCNTGAAADAGVVAVGYQAKGGGAASTAIGYQTTTSATLATAIGYLASASFNSAVAIGASSVASSGLGATAIGAQSQATAVYSASLGYGAKALANGAVAIGCDSTGTYVSTSTANEIRLGTTAHTVNIPGALIVAGSAITGGGSVADGSITSAKIADGAIMNADINASAGIALSKLATDPLARANHTGTQLASTVSNFDTQVRTSRLDQMAAPTGMLNFNNQTLNNVGVCSFTTGGSIVTDQTVGLGIGGFSGQKLAFWGNTPVVRDSGWTVGSYTPFRAGISSGITAADCANVLATLVSVLKSYGLLG